MKLIYQLLHVLESFKNRQTQAGKINAKDERSPDIETVPTELPAKSEHVTIRLTYAGEDTQYLKVKVGGKTRQIAKSRIQYRQDGADVVVTMTSRYAASRPELVIPQ